MKKYEFLTSDDITTTNAGELADEFYSAALEETESLQNGGVTLLNGITHKHVLPNITVADPVVAAACTFSDGDNITVAEQVLTLTDLKVNESVCIDALVPHWKGFVRSASRNGIEEPRFIDYVSMQIAKATGQSLERGIWRGTSPYGVGLQSNNGTLNEAGADASIFAGFSEVDFANALAATDIITDMTSVMQQAIADVPAILDQPGCGFYMGREAYWFYAEALAAAGSNQGTISGDTYSSGNKQGLTFQGFPVYMCPGMFADTIVMTYPGNVFVGTSLDTDFADIRVIDTRDTIGNDEIRYTGRFQVGVQVANAAEGVFGTTVWT